MFFINFHSDFDFNFYGIGLGVLSAFLYAVYIVTSKKMTPVHPITSCFIVSVGNAIFLLCASLVDGSFIVPTSFKINALLLGGAIFSTVFPMLFFLKGLKYISSTKASILSVLEPFCVVVIGVLFLKESLDFYKILGAIIVLVGALIINFKPTSNSSH